MASLDDLHRALFPTARPIGGRALSTERGRREVEWVRVLRSRVPAFEALDTGDVVIVPGSALSVVAPDAPRIHDLASALAVAGVPAVLLVGDEGRDALRALGTAATAARLTVLDLGSGDPVALERSIIGFLVNRRAELDRRAGELEAQLARLALLGQGLDALAGAISAFLGRAVVIEGRRGDALAVHAPADVPSAAAAVARHLARPDGPVALRVDIAAPSGAPGPGGHLVLLGRDPANEADRLAADRAAALLALELARDAAVRLAHEGTRRGEPLPADGPPWVVIVARQGAGRGPEDATAREAARAELRLLAAPRRLALRGSTESLEIRLVAAAPPDDPGGLAIADRVAAFLGRTVAVSSPFGEPMARAAAEAAARAALEAADLMPDPPPVVRAARLPAYRLLASVASLPDGQRQARALLAPILVGSPERQRERLATLAAVVGSASLGDAAARLGVHRNTIAYRVARLEQLGDWDLADPDTRFALELATRIVQLAQESEATPVLNRNPTS